MDAYDEVTATEKAYEFLKSNSTATLRFGEHLQDVSYTFAPDGRLVISAMYAMLQPCDTVLYVPEYGDNCMEMHVSLTQFTEEGKNGSIADKWQIYFGEPPDVQWACVDIDAARFHEMFIDGESLCRENTFREIERDLCKRLNENKDVLRQVCESTTGVEVADPFVVGVDTLGVDVRAPFGIVRIPAVSTFSSPEEVLQFFNVC